MLGKSVRFLAPIALVAVIVSTYLVIHAGLATHHTTPTQSGQLLGGARPHHRRPGRRYYIVKAGDTLSGISVTTHVSILRLTTLNPGVSPNSLQTGQRLRLRR